MSTIIGHSLAGVAISLAAPPKEKNKQKMQREWLWQTIYLVFVSLIADFDVLYGLAKGGTIFSLHRQGTHTIIFALFVSSLIYIGDRWLLKRKPERAWRWFFLTLSAMLTHLILDYIIQPLYFSSGINIYTGQENTIWGIFLPLLKRDGPKIMIIETVIITPVILLTFLIGHLRRNKK